MHTQVRLTGIYCDKREEILTKQFCKEFQTGRLSDMGIYYHDLEVMTSNPGRVELGGHSRAYFCPRLYLNQKCLMQTEHMESHIACSTKSYIHK